MTLAIGTAQFGLAYGLANTRGQVPLAEAAAIVDAARQAGCDTLDTAIAYGEAEGRLGEIGIRGWKVVTKLPAVPNDESDVSGWVRASVEGSLVRLKTGGLYGLLLHRPDQLMSARGDQLARALRDVRDAGLAAKIGVSSTAPEDLDVLSARVDLDLVQVPFNLFDRRLLEGGRLARLVKAGTEVHVRSVFLQGLLLMEEGRRAPAFDRWSSLWRSLSAWLAEHQVTALQACLRDVLSQTGISRAVVGIDSLAHWREIVASVGGPELPRPPAFETLDPDVFSPLVWLTYPAESMRPRA